MAFIHPKRFKHLKLPYKIKDEFSSISVTYPWPQACAHKGNVNSIHFETYFFDKFSSLFKAYWDYQYGIPTVYFTGKLDVFAEEVRHIPIFLLTLQNTYIDKLYHFTAPKILSDNRGKSCFAGAKAERISDCVNLKYETTEIYPPDILNIYFK